jgi:hypothetical protein
MLSAHCLISAQSRKLPDQAAEHQQRGPLRTAQDLPVELASEHPVVAGMAGGAHCGKVDGVFAHRLG